MNYRRVIFGGTVLCFSMFMSCSEDSDTVYSCDKQVDAWVKANVAEVRTMTRKQWKGLSNRVNIAVYRAFKPEQKVRFWEEKLKEVKEMDWTRNELEHIQKVEVFLSTRHNLFENRKLTTKEIDELETFFYKWQQEAEQNLGWDKKVAYSIAATGLSLKDKKGNVEYRKKSLRSSAMMSAAAEPSPEKLDCNCKIENPIACFPAGPTCDETDCSSVNYGCGWLLLQSCDGRCGGSNGL